MSFKLFISAAEDSAHLYAENLLEHLLKRCPDLESFGLGSPAMEAKGFYSLFNSKNFSIMGITDVFKRYFFLRKAFYALVQEIKRKKPNVVLLIDYPGFNLRLAKVCKKINIPVVYFIPPKIWASRGGRLKHLVASCDKILSILEFEKEFYKDFEDQFRYVGNPLVTSIPDNYLDSSFNMSIKQKYGFEKCSKVIALMPGSRNSEIKYILPTQIRVAEILYKNNPNLVFSIFLAPSMNRSDVQQYLEGSSLSFSVLKAASNTVLRIPDFILCASGTAVLYAALFLKPCVVMYRVHIFTAFVARFILNTKLNFFSLPNLILNKKVFPEFIQGNMKEEKIANFVIEYFASSAMQEETEQDLLSLKKNMQSDQPIRVVADTLLEYG